MNTTATNSVQQEVQKVLVELLEDANQKSEKEAILGHVVEGLRIKRSGASSVLVFWGGSPDAMVWFEYDRYVHNSGNRAGIIMRWLKVRDSQGMLEDKNWSYLVDAMNAVISYFSEDHAVMVTQEAGAKELYVCFKDIPMFLLGGDVFWMIGERSIWKEIMPFHVDNKPF